MKSIRRNCSKDIRSVFNLSNLFYFTKLKEIIPKYNTMTQFELDIFDFDNIPMSELDKAYIDYEPLYDTVDLFSVDED